jgi:hypothetical protein
MAIIELAHVKLLGGISVSDTSLRQNMQKVTEVIEGYNHLKNLFYVEVEDPSVLYVIGAWQSQEQHHSAPDYRGEGPKLEKWARDEGPPSENEGEFLRITRLGRCIRIYSVVEEYVDLDNKVYNFRPPWLYLLLLTLLPLLLPILLPLLLPISSAFALTTKISHSSTKF